jgi:hypothetical protein
MRLEIKFSRRIYFKYQQTEFPYYEEVLWNFEGKAIHLAK